MDSHEFVLVEPEAAGDFAGVMQVGRSPSARLNLNPANVKRGLGQLVLTLVKLLHELLERQAIRRIEGGTLSEQQIENLGLTLMRQSEELEKLRKEFGLEREDLNLDLGSIGRIF